jgi:hypothetical protein
MGCFGFRAPHTQQERRVWSSFEELKKEFPQLCLRFARNDKNLADAWDDVQRSDGDDRSWKRHRRYQAKGRVFGIISS